MSSRSAVTRRRSPATGRFPSTPDSASGAPEGAPPDAPGVPPAALDLSNHFAVAMPAMADPNFAGSVVLIAEHNERGALGLVINRPGPLTLRGLFERIDLAPSPGLGALTSRDDIGGLPGLNDAAPGRLEARFRNPVYIGGPVQTDRGFVLHEPGGQYTSTVAISEHIALTTSRDVLESVARGAGPERLLITLGYAGWGPGQLEDEIAANAWLTMPAEAAVLFEVPAEERFHAAFQLLGIDPAKMALAAGHA